MRETIIETEAMGRFDSAVDEVMDAERGFSGFVLAYGQAGRGKSVAADRYHYTRAVLYRATAKAAASPETPYPPIRETDPFQKERTAAATITRLMLCADPYAQKTARTIAEACQVLLARFGGTVTENENREESTC